MLDADLKALFIAWAPSFGADGALVGTLYAVRTYNVESNGVNTLSATKGGALAAAKPFIDANPGVVVIDTTD
jgi:hypothetical protein